MSHTPNTTEQRKEIFLEALKKNLNIITAACEQSGVPRGTYYDWMKYDKEFRKKVDEIQEIQTDFVESQLLKKIKEGSEKSILFYMRFRGKKRGYTDSIDITTNGENLNHIQIEIINKKPDEDSSNKDI
jgi:hypothetical protein